MRWKFGLFLSVWLACSHTALATSQLIVNGAFSGTSYAPWQTSGVGIQFGAGYASMGNYNGAQQSLYQQVTFPTNLIGATLSLYNETASGDPNADDYLTVYITDSSGAPQIELAATSSGVTSSSFIFSATNFISYAGSNLLSSFAGQTVDLLFYVTTDPSYGVDTSFYLTDVSLIAGTTADIPANDDFTNAAIIPSDGITNDVTTTYASRENYEPQIGGNRGGHSLWWEWTAPASGTVTISTAGSQFSTLLGVYTGTALQNLVLLTNSDGYKLSSGLASLKFPVAAGAQYRVGLDGYDGASGIAGFTYTFKADAVRPTVAITSPLSGADVTNSTVLAKGTASDNVGVAFVQYQLENANGASAWQLAAGTTAWSATITNLAAGTNTIRVESIDTSSNISTIVSRVVNYTIPVPLTLAKVGAGTITGATNGQMLHLGYPYKLTATAAAGFKFEGWTGSYATNTATLSFIMTSNVSETATFVDAQKPVLSVTAPLSKARWSNSVFTVTGKASDNVGVASVWYQVNGGPWSTDVNTSNRFTNWTAAASLSPGANTVKAFAMDAAGNMSLTNSVSFVYALSATVTVGTNGPGKVTPNYNDVLLAINTNYSMTATAAKGYVFSNWTDGTGVVVSGTPILKFVMASNLSFTANFVSNPFTLAGGTYQGLFYGSNAAGLTPAGSGFFSAVVKTNGAFTAKFQQGAGTFPISGQFSLSGVWSTNALKTWAQTAIGLQLDLTGGESMEGGLLNSNWTAGLSASLAAYSTAHPSPQAGKKFTLILPGSTNFGEPGGNGFGSVSVSASGTVTFAGTLGNGTAVTETGTESSLGQWPMYISLDSGGGMLLGWLEFTNEPDRDIDGLLNWFLPKSSAAVYPGGFTNSMQVAGSEYSLPTGAQVLDLTNGYVLLEDGGLAQDIRNSFYLSAKDAVSGSNKMQLTFTAATGLFQGSVTNGAKPIAFKGAVLQKQNTGYGQFVNGAQTGSVSVSVAP